MENPASWPPEVKVIHEALIDSSRKEEAGYIGHSAAFQVYIALRESGHLRAALAGEEPPISFGSLLCPVVCAECGDNVRAFCKHCGVWSCGMNKCTKAHEEKCKASASQPVREPSDEDVERFQSAILPMNRDDFPFCFSFTAEEAKAILKAAWEVRDGAK